VLNIYVVVLWYCVWIIAAMTVLTCQALPIISAIGRKSLRASYDISDAKKFKSNT